MPQAKPKIRLYVAAEYGEGRRLALNPPQTHYLVHVMRLSVGDTIGVFNGRDGEWLAELAAIDKRQATLRLKGQLAPQRASPDLWLAFSPIRNKTELVVEKAAELGVSKIMPVVMQHSVVRSVNQEKLVAHAVEAAEQCGRHDVPLIEPAKNMVALLAEWPQDRTLLYADESGGGAPLSEVVASLHPGKYAVLIGPEGGFAAEEQRLLKASPQVKPFGMGPRILRADTASVAALSCLQAWMGDWESKPRFACLEN